MDVDDAVDDYVLEKRVRMMRMIWKRSTLKVT